MSVMAAVSTPSAKASLRQGILPGLLLLAFANGMYARIMLSIAKDGFWDAFYGTFGISIVIWVGMWMAWELSREVELSDLNALDVSVLSLAGLLVFLPVSGLSWAGLTLVSIYFLVTRSSDLMVRRLFWVVLAICFSSLWTRLIMRFFMEYILRIDTILVAGMTGTESSGNLIKAADGLTTLQVLEGCSSFSNLSLAFVGWILARSHYGTRGIGRGALFVALSCALVVLINTIRIGIIALRPDLYDLAHGPTGANIASLLCTISIGAVSLYGARR